MAALDCHSAFTSCLLHVHFSTPSLEELCWSHKCCFSFVVSNRLWVYSCTILFLRFALVKQHSSAWRIDLHVWQVETHVLKEKIPYLNVTSHWIAINYHLSQVLLLRCDCKPGLFNGGDSFRFFFNYLYLIAVNCCYLLSSYHTPFKYSFCFTSLSLPLSLS